MPLYIAIAIIIIIAVAYLAIYFGQRIIVQRANAIAEKKNELEQKDVQAELLAGRKLALTGQSLKDYQALEADYNLLVNNKFIGIDQQLEVVSFDAKGINIFKTIQEYNRLKSLYSEAESSIDGIHDGMVELTRLDNERKQTVKDLKSKYEDLRKRLLAENYKYGPASESLESFFENVESNFDEFAELTAKGNHTEATTIYEQLKTETAQLEDMMVDIPGMINMVESKYVDQLKEIKEGQQQLLSQGFIFDDDVDELLDSSEKMRTQVLDEIATLQLSSATNGIDVLGRQIQKVYDIIENEYASKAKVEQNESRLDSEIERLQKQNQTLMIELDRLAQKFELNHQEVENARLYEEQIKQLVSKNVDNKSDLRTKQIPYSRANENQETYLKDANGLDQEQRLLYEKISSYDNQLFDVQKTWAQVDNDLNNLRRTIEHMNLPGLPSSYRLVYSSVRDQLSQVDDATKSSKVDLDNVLTKMTMIQTDFQSLREQSNQLLDDSTLADQVMQRATRYRSDPRVLQALEQGKMLYEKNYDYAGAQQVVGQALDLVENNGWESIRQQYSLRRRDLF